MKVTITVPVVYMARDGMILMRANPLRVKCQLEWEGPEMATSDASAIWALKSLDFQGPTLPMVLVMDTRKYT